MCNNHLSPHQTAKTPPKFGANSCASEPPLGNYAKSASTRGISGFQDVRKKKKLSRKERLRLRYQTSDEANRLVVREGAKQGLKFAINYHKVAKCQRVAYGQVAVLKSQEHGTAHYKGLVTCGNVFACPICSAKVGERRRSELADLIDAVYAGRLGLRKKAIMVTLTFSHKFDDELKPMIKRFSKALGALKSGRFWDDTRADTGYEGQVRALEITHGQNGWHPHTHELWIVDEAVDVAQLRKRIALRWLTVCQRRGLVGEGPDQVRHFLERSVDILDNCRASDYLAKTDKTWGVDSELARASTKRGRKSGRTQFQLLEDSAAGDERAGNLYIEFIDALRGRASLYWSRGLKKRVGIDDKTDEELAVEQEDDALILLLISHFDWNLIRRLGKRADVLIEAESGGVEAVMRYITKLRALEPAEA